MTGPPRSRLIAGGAAPALAAAILCLLAAYGFAPLVAVAIHVAEHGGTMTGANGGDFYDQFQYLAWIRDAGSHILASNLWVVGPTPHDYLHPMYVVSGLLWRLGLSIQLAYLVWKPVAVLALFLGFSAYVRHLLPERPWQQAAALFLALFYHTPVSAIAQWTTPLSPVHNFQLSRVTEDLDSSLQLWGFDHAAIAVGLTPVFLLAAEKLLAGEAEPRRIRRWRTVAGVSGLLVAWLHPWQAVILIVIVIGLILLRPPRRRYVTLALPIAATVAPLIYTQVLTYTDASWRAFQHSIGPDGPAPAWALLVALGPLVALAALGSRRPRSYRDWMLVLWPPAVAVVYFFGPHFSPHALSGVTLPLAVMAVSGWTRACARARLGLGLAAPLAVLAILAFTVPSAVQHLQSVHDDLQPTIGGAISQAELRLTDDQAAALEYLDHAKRKGGVLARPSLSLAVPEFTGRQTFVGHRAWEPASRLSMADAFFNPSLPEPRAAAIRSRILKASHAAFVVLDCDGPRTFAQDIGSTATLVKRFGCVAVYEVGRA